MIEIVAGNLLDSPMKAHVNTVNTAGVMGKGLALQFRSAYLTMFQEYQRACHRGLVQVGTMHVFDRGPLFHRPRWIINFPTKRHWSQPSQLGYIREGLVDLVHQIRERSIPSIAVPALGCQNGGLAWKDVEPLIRTAFAPLEDVHVQLFQPR